jgi:hypothetical protein
VRLPSNLTLKLLLLCIACALLAPATASADSAPPMIVAVHPASGPLRSYFDFPARPGRPTVAGTLEVRNRTGRRVVVLVDPVDAVTATTFGSAYKVRGLPIHGQTLWTQVTGRRVALAPHGSRLIRVTVRPPASAKPGDYLSGIGIQAAVAGTQQRLRGNVAISSIQRYAVGLLARVPGSRRPHIQLTGGTVDREPAGLTFFLQGRNDGNVVLQNVHGRVQVTRGSRVVADMPMGAGTFVDGTSIAYPVPAVHEQPQEGTVFRMRAVVYYPGGVARLDVPIRFGHAAAVRQENFGGPKANHGGVPTWLLALLAIGAVGAAGSLIRVRGRRLRSGLRTIERALHAARERAEPLSLIRLAVGHGHSIHRLPVIARSRLRRDDVICKLDDSAIVVVARDTSPAAADALAAEIRRDLERAENVPAVAVDVYAVNGDHTAADLLARMSAAPDELAGPRA